MKTKKFDELAKQILTQDQIEESKQNARIEYELMTAISEKLKAAMENEHIGFNELVRRLNTSPTQINKMLKGNANLTLNSLIRVCSILKIMPVINFKKAT